MYFVVVAWGVCFVADLLVGCFGLAIRFAVVCSVCFVVWWCRLVGFLCFVLWCGCVWLFELSLCLGICGLVAGLLMV